MPRRLTIALCLATNVSALAAQSGLLCSARPGLALGVSSYTCTNCTSVKQDGGLAYIFGDGVVVSEPVPGSPFQEGDVIIAVNNKLLASRAGAQNFAFPHSGLNDVRFHRTSPDGSENIHAAININQYCKFASTTAVAVRRGDATTPDSSSSVETATTIRPAGGTITLGLAIACNPGCTQGTASDETIFWKHSAFPTVVGVGHGTVAGDADLAIGDHIVSVDNQSVLDEKGALGLLQPAASRLDLVIERDGHQLKRTLNTGPLSSGCDGRLYLIVNNPTATNMEVYVTSGGSSQFYTIAPPGRMEFPLPPGAINYLTAQFSGRVTPTQSAATARATRAGATTTTPTVQTTIYTRGFQVVCRN